MEKKIQNIYDDSEFFSGYKKLLKVLVLIGMAHYPCMILFLSRHCLYSRDFQRSTPSGDRSSALTV
jgi:hypothetical protein